MASMSARHPLGDWMKALRQVEGWSYADVAALAARHGHKVSTSNVERMEKVPPSMVKREQIEWISDVFSAPPRTVIRLFLASMGYSLSETSVASIEDAVRMDQHLSSDDKDQLILLAAHMHQRNMRRGGSNADAEPREKTPGGAPALSGPPSNVVPMRPPVTEDDLRGEQAVADNSPREPPVEDPGQPAD